MTERRGGGGAAGRRLRGEPSSLPLAPLASPSDPPALSTCQRLGAEGRSLRGWLGVQEAGRVAEAGSEGVA